MNDVISAIKKLFNAIEKKLLILINRIKEFFISLREKKKVPPKKKLPETEEKKDLFKGEEKK